MNSTSADAVSTHAVSPALTAGTTFVIDRGPLSNSPRGYAQFLGASPCQQILSPALRERGRSRSEQGEGAAAAATLRAAPSPVSRLSALATLSRTAGEGISTRP